MLNKYSINMYWTVTILPVRNKNLLSNLYFSEHFSFQFLITHSSKNILTLDSMIPGTQICLNFTNKKRKSQYVVSNLGMRNQIQPHHLKSQEVLSKKIFFFFQKIFKRSINNDKWNSIETSWPLSFPRLSPYSSPINFYYVTSFH